MLVYHATIDLDTGFEVLREPKGSRLVRGKSISLPSGAKLFEHLHGHGIAMTCWSCGIEANCFIVNKGQNDRMGPPVLDLFAMRVDGPVLMTRDHIIPKSYGGVNDVENLRIGCGPCNHGRGNELEADDIEFMRSHPELIGPNPKYKLADNVTFVSKSGPAKLTPEEQAERTIKRKAKLKAAKKRKVKRKAENMKSMALTQRQS